MLIYEASKRTGLTKKAIAYYCAQGLITPAALENGYRAFSPEDMERLQKIAVLRKLNMPVEELRVVLDDATGEALKQFAAKAALQQQAEHARQETLRKLCAGMTYSEAQTALDALDAVLPFPHEYLHAFPSYFGRFFSQYFARFLQDPAVSERQQAAYAQILEFLDNVTLPDFPKNVRECLESITPEEEQDCLNNSLANMRSLLKAPEAYIKAHRQTLEQYMDFRKSDEYRDSPAYQIQAQMNA